MKTRMSLLAAATLLIGVSAIGEAHAGNATNRVDAAAPRRDAHHADATLAQSAASPGDRNDARYVARRSNETNAVTTRTPGIHDDGYRSTRAWWKDD